MADAVSHTFKPPKLPAHQVTSDNPANNPGKFYSNFLYKAALVTVFIVLLPLFPSIAPEFINQTLHARSWELLQLIFVGIAVSYGLFSKKNDQTEKDHGSSKLDNAQSFVTKLLQVSSVSDDGSESGQTIDEENNKFETLSSKYYRGEPVVVVAQQSPDVFKYENGCEITQEPLLLPVRSLNQRLPDANEFDLGDESGGKASNRSRFNSSSRKPRNVEVGGSSFQKMDENLEEDLVVLRSPIPWRTRSGRMEMKENEEEIELKGIDEKSTSFRSVSKTNSSSLKNLSIPSTSFPSESQAKTSEDDVVRKNYYFSSSPPPPPPTSKFLRKSVLSKSNSSFINNAIAPEKVLRRSVRSAPAEEELSECEMEELLRSRIQNDGLANSVRTYKSSEVEKKSMDFYERMLVDKKGYTGVMSNGKLPKEELVEKAMMETSAEDTEAESTEEKEEEEEEDYFKRISSGDGEVATDDNNSNSVNDAGPDVDKKADEFIAKFREQIRLQRIESFRRSTASHAGKALR